VKNTGFDDISIGKAFGERIKLLRTQRNMTQLELAAKMGIEYTNLQKYENNRQGITLKYLNRMANAFEITLSELLQFEE
jgi:transcriptional regulator with XRE-family HTH domain